MKDNMKIDYKIVNLRFLAILLVVLGHSIIIYRPDWTLYTANVKNNAFMYIDYFVYLFHMPLFFAISGYLTNMKKDGRFKDLIIKKTKRLIIPYFIIGMLWLLPIRYICKYTNYINNSLFYNIIFNIVIGKDSGHLWYLYSLFIIFVFSYFIEKNIKNKYFKVLIIIIVFFLGNKIPSYLGQACTNLFWFYLGKSMLKIRCESSKNKSFLLIIPSILLVLLYFYTLNNIFLSSFIRFAFCIIFIPFLFIIVPNIRYEFSNYISNNSFGIYLFHSPLMYFSFCYLPYINPFLMLIINFLVFGVISLIITQAISKTKLKFILGG